LQQLLFSNTRCLCPSLAAARQLCSSRSSCQATGTAGQQSTDGQVAAADTSVLDTVKLLEAGIWPLSQQPMVRVNSQTAAWRLLASQVEQFAAMYDSNRKHMGACEKWPGRFVVAVHGS
jgi:hypothetical protein